jgi:hypothetical protein
MDLYMVTIDAAVRFGEKYKSDNTLILCAETEKEAQDRAENFFTARGLYVLPVPGATPLAGTKPRVLDVKQIPLTAMFYNGHLVENPEQYLRRMPKDPTDFEKLVRNLSADEYQKRCDADPEFKEKADRLGREK